MLLDLRHYIPCKALIRFLGQNNHQHPQSYRVILERSACRESKSKSKMLEQKRKSEQWPLFLEVPCYTGPQLMRNISTKELIPLSKIIIFVSEIQHKVQPTPNTQLNEWLNTTNNKIGCLYKVRADDEKNLSK